MNKVDEIYVKIRCTSEECDQIREGGMFFQTIADALWIDRKDIKEIIEKNRKI